MPRDEEQVIYDEGEDRLRMPLPGKEPDVRQGGMVLYETLKAPILSSTDRKDLIAFKLLHDKYLRQHEEANRNNKTELPPTSFKMMIEPGLLETVCKWELRGISSCDATSKELKAWVHEQISQDRSSDAMILATMRTLSMNEKIVSPAARVLNLVQQWDKVIRENGWQSVFMNKKGREQAVKYLTDAVRPKGLQNLVKNELRLQMENQLESKPAEFFKMLKDKAIAWAQVQAYQEPDKYPKGHEKKRQRDENPKHSTNKKLVCFKCGKEGHPIFKCPLKPSKDEIKSLLEKAKSNRNTENKHSKKIRSYIRVCRVGSDRNQIEVGISESNVYFRGIIDSGADYTLIPRKVALQAMARDSKLRLEKLSSPVELRLGDHETFTTVHEVITVDLTLQTKAGELVTRKRQCLVWDVESDEILLGNELLQEIGIDPKSALEELIRRKKDASDEETLSYNFSDMVDYEPLIGEDMPEDIVTGIDDMIQRAVQNGLPQKWIVPLTKLTRKYLNVWRRQMGSDPAAGVTPFETKLKPDATPYRCKARKYSAEQSEFMEQFTSSLMKYGLVYENFNSQWASPVVVVRKPGNKGFRMCVDLRAVNDRCEATAWPMPFLETMVQSLAGSKFWFSLDAFKGFWIMPLAKDCQEMFSFMTDKGVFTPTRSIQGALNSASQFQARMYEIYKELLFESLIIWIDDLLGHAPSEGKWFQILARTLELAEKYDLKFNLDKCNLFLKEAKFCGKVFTPEGVKHDMDRIKALVAIPQPRTARDLQQFMMAAQWMSRSIPEYNTLMHSLQEIFEVSMKEQQKRTKTAARAVVLVKYGWTPKHALAFEKAKLAIANCVQLSYPRDDMIQCVFGDANDYNSSGCVTQIPLEDADLEITKARHEPLGFVGHRFTGAELNWSTPEQEAFAIKDVVTKLCYLLQMKRPFRLYTDHKNLVSMFSPSNVTRQTAQKLQRWSMDLMAYKYVIFHIKGEDNVWADLMTRWGAPEGADADSTFSAPVMVRRIVSTRSALEEQARVRPMHNSSFVWPTIKEIVAIQNEHMSEQLKKSLKVNELGLLTDSEGIVRIPDKAKALQIRLCVIAHSGGNSGHIGYQACYHAMSKWCRWTNMQQDLARLCNKCLHCLPTRGGIRIPRPLGTACHGMKPNQVLHFDFIYIAPRKSDCSHEFEWLLIIRDDLSGFVRIYPCKTPDSVVTVDALLDWRSSYGTSEIYVSDRASYFISSVMKELAARCNVEQHWTTAYSHYPNGSIEVINRLFLTLIRALISELRIDKNYWPSLIKLIEHTLNHRLQKRLGWLAPVTVMTGLKSDNPLQGIFRTPDMVEISSVAMESASIKEHVTKLQESLDSMHKDVVELSAKERKRHRDRGNIQRKQVNFGIGDFVLLGIPENQHGQKLFLKWRGPYQVKDTKQGYVFIVEDIITKVTKVAHADRLRLYDDKLLDLSDEIKYQFSYDNGSYEVEELKQLRFSPTTHDLEFLVKWRGFSDMENSWEPCITLWNDVPVMVERFAKDHKDDPLIKKLDQVLAGTNDQVESRRHRAIRKRPR